MNILFFLIPKNNVVYIHDECTVRQALEKIYNQGYTAIPILNRDGQYTGTVTEGDFLRLFLKQDTSDMSFTENMLVRDVPRRVKNKSVCIDATIEDLLLLTMNQNFVPVTDDRHKFIGIVTRKDIIQYYYSKELDENTVESEV